MNHLLLLLLGCLALPGWAKVIDSTAHGFTVVHEVQIAASPQAVYAAFVEVGQWWDGAHSYSGEATNFELRLEPGGCLCERLPTGGWVEHLRVVGVMPGQMVRFTGGLGPLQSLGVAGSMTWTWAEVAEGETRFSLRYTVGGYVPGRLAGWAAPVDGVLGQQVARLARYATTGDPDPQK